MNLPRPHSHGRLERQAHRGYTRVSLNISAKYSRPGWHNRHNTRVRLSINAASHTRSGSNSCARNCSLFLHLRDPQLAINTVATTVPRDAHTPRQTAADSQSERGGRSRRHARADHCGAASDASTRVRDAPREGLFEAQHGNAHEGVHGSTRIRVHAASDSRSAAGRAWWV